MLTSLIENRNWAFEKYSIFPFFSKQKVGLIWQLFLPAVPGISGLEREPSSTREKTWITAAAGALGWVCVEVGNECERIELESFLWEEHGLFRA